MGPQADGAGASPLQRPPLQGEGPGLSSARSAVGCGEESPEQRLLSPRLIAEDNEGGLFTVTLFRKVIEDFKTKAKENK